jgi:ribosomal protein L16/L10AE
LFRSSVVFELEKVKFEIGTSVKVWGCVPRLSSVRVTLSPGVTSKEEGVKMNWFPTEIVTLEEAAVRMTAGTGVA